ncbi:MAG: hypothetical protein HYV07_24285 [Deltaproteobacteria bacterium]|nr:hypothetical protein [Deltaproteobacteria bacterium]
MIARIVPALSILSCALACTSDLLPASVITRTRIVAVRADPPELAPSGTSRLDALVVDPDGGTHAFAWYACAPRAPGESSPCTSTDTVGDEDALASSPGVRLVGSSTSAWLMADAEVPLEPARTIDVVLFVDDGAHGLTARKEVRVTSSTPNQNPEVAFVVASGFRVEDDDEIVSTPEVEIPWSAIVTEASTEAFERRLPGGSTERDVEGLTYEWLTTWGRFGLPYRPPSARPVVELFVDSGLPPPRDASFEEGGGKSSADDRGPKVTLRLPAGIPEPNPIKVIVLVRDGRGGVGWAARSLLVRDR